MIWDEEYLFPAAVLAAFVVPWLAGLALASVARSVGRAERLALAYPLATAITYVAMLALAPAESELVRAYGTLAAHVVVIAVALLARGRHARESSEAPRSPWSPFERILLIVLLAQIPLHATRALVTGPPRDLKGLVEPALASLHLARFGMDASYFAAGTSSATMPPLLPLQEAWLTHAFGGENGPAARFVPLLLLASALAYAFHFLRRRSVPRSWALGTVLLLASAPAIQRHLFEPRRAVIGAGFLALATMLLLDGLRTGMDGSRMLLAGSCTAALAATSVEGAGQALLLLCAVLAIAVRGRTERRGQGLARFAIPPIVAMAWWGAILAAHQVAAPALAWHQEPGAFASRLARILGAFWAQALSARGDADTFGPWLLIVPGAVLAAVARPRRFARGDGAWLWLLALAAVGLEAAFLALVPGDLETLLAGHVADLTFELMPLLFLAFGTAMAETPTIETT